jgi:hypothetical protein
MLHDEYQSMAANAICHQAFLTGETLRQEYTRPCITFKPRLFPDGDQWCVLYGENLQSGVAGFGPSPDEAMRAFDSAFTTPQLPGVSLSILAQGGHMKRIAFAAVLLLVGCDVEAMRESNRQEYSETPLLVSTAPDGTKLWRVYDRITHQQVYFSTAGASWETRIAGDGAGIQDRIINHQTPSAKR